MQTKVIPIAARGWTRTFFSLGLDDTDLSHAPHLQLPRTTEAQFALELADQGLASLGIRQGDYMLFGATLPLRAAGQMALIRQEDEYIVREAHWSGDTTVLRVPGDRFPALKLPTENIRIVAVLDNVIKNDEHARLVYFR